MHVFVPGTRINFPSAISVVTEKRALKAHVYRFERRPSQTYQAFYSDSRLQSTVGISEAQIYDFK